MNTHADKTQENKSQSEAHTVPHKQNGGETTFQFVDNRPKAIAQRKLQEMANNSSRILQLKAFKEMANQSDTVQRVRIKLRDEDPVLMAELRNAEVPNAGAQTADNIVDARNVNDIGINENIILEGHGYYNNPMFGQPKVVGQGGLAPARIAAVAHSVPKPGDWNGKIILLGCKTGDITSQVSKEYFLLTNSQVEVIGTKANIKVGMAADGTSFVGTDYARLPENEHPNDLAFVRELFQETETFQENVLELRDLIIELRDYQRGQRVNITKSLGPILMANNGLIVIDLTSSSVKEEGKNYMLAERRVLWNAFNDVVKEINKVSFFNYPNNVAPLQNTPIELQEVTNVTQLLLPLMGAMQNGFLDLQRYYRGLQLKRIDFDDNESSQHSKMERTNESIFGDTWADRS